MSSAASPHAPSRPDSAAPNTAAIVRRLLRDYIRGEWGVAALAVFCMLLTSAVSGLVPHLLNLEVKLIFLRHEADMLLPMSLAVVGVVAFRAVTLFLGRMWLDSLGEKTVRLVHDGYVSDERSVSLTPKRPAVTLHVELRPK